MDSGNYDKDQLGCRVLAQALSKSHSFKLNMEMFLV